MNELSLLVERGCANSTCGVAGRKPAHGAWSSTGMLRDRQIEYLHLHNAKPGCFAASVARA
jgi:hypothetical protein